MGKISYDKRLRIVTLYNEHKLHFSQGRFHLLQSLAERESIFTTERTVRRIVKHWQETGSIADKESLTRSNNLTKITVN